MSVIQCSMKATKLNSLTDHRQYPFVLQGTCKCSQKLLVQIMNGFSLDQKDAVNKAGFGSLLNLKESKLEEIYARTLPTVSTSTLKSSS